MIVFIFAVMNRLLIGLEMPLDNRLITVVFILALNVGHLLANSDPRVIAYDDLKSTADMFSEPRVSHFSQLLFNGHGGQQELIVGASDNIYRLTIDHLQPLEKAEWKASSTKIDRCIEKGQSENDCKNYIKVLHVNGNQLFACGTDAFAPNCTKRELKNINHIIRTDNGLAKCPCSPHANVTSLISEDGSFFAGIPLGFAGADSAIVRDSDTKTFLRTTQYDSKWLNDPQFVGSFETDSFVYFLFREGAIEYMNCGKAIYSRIARVCKQDPGEYKRPPVSWTTFVKTRLNCSLPGEYPFYFDEIQGVSYLPDTGLMYATFTTPRNSIPGSAICVFNLAAINAAFNGSYKDQLTSGSAWESVPNDHQKQCQNYENRYSSKYQLMDNAVQSMTKTPLYHSQLERIVHIAVDELIAKRQKEKINIRILYVSTEENVIKKISILPDTLETCILEIWRPTSDLSDRILSMHYLREKESLYIGTQTTVMRIPSQHCDRYKNKQTCLDAKDPYCGWNEHASQCTPPPDKNPLTPHWNQLINECPRFIHPVPGGWSKWSTWIPCNQADSLNGIDQCLCSSRQCNNPAPQKGGADCEGVHIRVTNCTMHGGWTDWSEWSACSQSCGKDAVKTRKRTCTNPAPAFGGRVCVGQESDFAVCFDNPPCPPPTPAYSCPLWKPWSECAAKCGDGYQYRTRELMGRAESLSCSGNLVEVRKCSSRACPTAQKVVEWTQWECSENDIEERYKISSELHNSTFIKVQVQKEERNSSERASCTDICGLWSNWTECNQLNVQTRTRKCLIGNNGRRCPCSDEERKPCHNDYSLNQPIVLESSASISLVTLLLACFLSFIFGIGGLALFCYYKIKKEHHLIPSSPLYATKQNFYVNVPLREPSTPKRTPSFSKNSTLPNSTPKTFTKPLLSNGNTTPTTTTAVKAIIKPMEYDTATIKRNSNNLKNGYTRSFDFDAEADDRFS